MPIQSSLSLSLSLYRSLAISLDGGINSIRLLLYVRNKIPILHFYTKTFIVIQSPTQQRMLIIWIPIHLCIFAVPPPANEIPWPYRFCPINNKAQLWYKHSSIKIGDSSICDENRDSLKIRQKTILPINTKKYVQN